MNVVTEEDVDVQDMLSIMLRLANVEASMTECAPDGFEARKSLLKRREDLVMQFAVLAEEGMVQRISSCIDPLRDVTG